MSKFLKTSFLNIRLIYLINFIKTKTRLKWYIWSGTGTSGVDRKKFLFANSSGKVVTTIITRLKCSITTNTNSTYFQLFVIIGSMWLFTVYARNWLFPLFSLVSGISSSRRFWERHLSIYCFTYMLTAHLRNKLYPWVEYFYHLTDTGLSWPQKASRIFARLFSRAINKNQVVLNFLLPDIDIVNNLLK